MATTLGKQIDFTEGGANELMLHQISVVSNTPSSLNQNLKERI
jgi:hypothetical protein